MANFLDAFKLVIKNEGGYDNDPDDTGGETYKGVARNMNKAWPGWTNVDLLKKKSGFPSSLEKDIELQMHVENIYKEKYWDPLDGDDIKSQEVAFSIFDFAVNAGVKTSIKLAQIVLDVEADGIAGPATLSKINTMEDDHFLAAFTVAKIVRYYKICESRPINRKYFYGWVRRALNLK